MLKHGAYVDPGNSDLQSVVLYWMGEKVELKDFNERLLAQAKSAAQDLDWMLKGSELTAAVNEGEKAVSKLEEVEKIAKLPLCKDCRKLIGDLS